jgi:hypothetical protein
VFAPSVARPFRHLSRKAALLWRKFQTGFNQNFSAKSLPKNYDKKLLRLAIKYIFDNILIICYLLWPEPRGRLRKNPVFLNHTLNKICDFNILTIVIPEIMTFCEGIINENLWGFFELKEREGQLFMAAKAL